MPRILMVASEAAPFAKTGGLADVLGSLPAALVRLGEEVAVVLPRYRSIPLPHDPPVLAQIVNVGRWAFRVAVYEQVRHGVRYFFVDCPPLYDRAGIYGDAAGDFNDNHLRFALLNVAAIEIARRVFRPDVFHAHDWQAGLLPVYLRENLAFDPTFTGVRCVFTIHNLGYTGGFPTWAVADCGLDRVLFHPEGLEFFGDLSFLKAGIVWSDAVTTVSPTYAREIQTPEFGFGMDGLLRSRAFKLSGILNGVDYEEWNPATDAHLAANYSAENLAGKQACKTDLLAEMRLEPDGGRPLMGIVSRFAFQKGMDIVAEAVSWAGTRLEETNLVVLGSGDSALESAFRDLALSHPGRIAVRLGYNEGLAHRIEAGSDVFLMPSRYEPCGLNQIYSLRYGTPPVVRATGGLQDTVDAQTGFKFRGFSPQALVAAATEALDAYGNPEAWQQRIRRGMAKDFSWAASARQYQKLYRTS